jgi:hypothetical protein
MPIVGEDGNFFVTDTGGRIAKSGLSPDKSAQYQQLIAQSLQPQPQMSQAPMPAASAPMMSTIQAPQAAPIWEQPAAFSATTPEALNLGPAPQQASIGGMPLDLGAQKTAPTLNDLGQQVVKDLESGIGMQQAGIQKQLNAQTKMQQEVEKERIALDRAQTIIDFDIMREQEARDSRVNEAMGKIDTLRSNYAQAKIDPSRVFGNDTGKRIMAGIAIAFGSIGSALTGGENTALKIINKAIDDDVTAQKEEMSSKQAQITLERQGLADVKDLFKDRIEAQIAQRTMRIEAAQRQIQTIADRYGTQEAQGKAQVLIGQLEVNKAEGLAKLQELAAKDVNRNAAPLTDQQIKAVSDLSSAYEGNEGIKSFNKIDQAYKKMENLAKLAQTNPNAAQGLITTFNRVLDENSVVREAEVNLTMSAGSVVDKFKQQAEKAISGKMTPEQTANLVEAAKELRNAALAGKMRLDQRFTDRARAFGVPADLVISQQPLSAENTSQLSSFTPRGQEPAQKKKTANVMPGR